jgi:outer membrane protein TolC
VKNDLSKLYANQEPVTGPISLHEAMARAMAYNLDFRLELLKKSLASNQLDLSRYDQLPSLVTNINNDNRDNYSGASSRSLTTGLQSLESSTSSDKRVTTADFGLSWNVLDFGVSYYRAQQSADRVLVTEEQKRKVINRILKDVRSLYWRAVSNDRLVGRVEALLMKVNDKLDESRRVEAQRLDTPLTTLLYQRELIDSIRELQDLHESLMLAKTELASLMNLPPGQDYQLLAYDKPESTPPLGYSPQFMEVLALENRSELREVSYNKRINSKQAKEALLNLLPGINLELGTNYSSNGYLYNTNWVDMSARISWNLINIFKYPATKRLLESQSTILDAQRLALSMAILTQVHIGIVQYQHAKKEYQTALDYNETQNKILQQIQAAVSAKSVSTQVLVREEMNTLLAEVKYDIAFANLESSYADSLASLGIYPSVDELDTSSIESLAKSLEVYYETQRKYNDRISMQLNNHRRLQ